MRRIGRFWDKYWIYIIAFLVPWMVVILVSVIYDGWPTGSGSLLNGDSFIQLLPFARELWEKVHSGDNMMYTWNVAGGCDFYAILGNYLSPFTLLFLIFPKNCVASILQIILVLKWSCAGVSMVYYFYNTKYNTLLKYKKIVSLFLGVIFMLSSCQINMVRYFQFTDVTICFPILLLLIERMVDYKKWMLYCAFLAFIIISNNYMAYEVCLFLIMWFFFQFDHNTTEKLKKFFMFALSSTLSALSASWFIEKFLLISQNRININADSNNAIDYSKSVILGSSDFIQQLFIFSPIHSPYRVEPNIYFSIIGVLLVLLFVFIKIDIRKKIYLLACSVFMICSFFNGSLSLLWHLFNVPNGVYHRFSNIFIFLMLFLILHVFIRLEDIQPRHIRTVGTMSLVGFAYTFFSIKIFDLTIIYIATLVLLVFYLVLLVLFSKKSITYNKMMVCILLFGFSELLFNACYLFNDNYNYYDISDREFLDMCGLNAFENMDLENGERFTTTLGYDNAGLYGNENSISGFLSSINGNLFELLGRLGMGNTGHVEYTVKGGSPLINLMFNIRYIVTNSVIDTSDAEMTALYYDSKLYETKRLAGFGYMVKNDIIDWDPYNKTCFEGQNSFAELASGVSDKLFTVVNPDVKCVDITNKEIERDKNYIDNDGYVYNFDSSYGNENDSIQIEFIADEDMDLYVDERSTFAGRVSTLIDNKMVGRDSDGYKRSTIHVGNVKKGQKISLVVIARNDYYVDNGMSVFFRFAKFNDEAYSKVYKELNKNTLRIDTFTSDYVKGRVVAEEEGIMMTSVQSDMGFDVYVDGEETKCESIGNALIGVPLSKGSHTVEFKYVGFPAVLGKIISIISISIYLVLCIIHFIKEKKRNVLVGEG